MKTVLMTPPWFCLQNRGKRDAHLGLACIAGVLVEDGHEVVVLDGERVLAPHTLSKTEPVPPIFFHATEQYLDRCKPDHPLWAAAAAAVLREKPDVLGMTAWTAAVGPMLNVMRAVKRARPGITTVVGGVHATLMPRELALMPEVDFVVCGEGEIAARRLWARFRTGTTDFSSIPGVWFMVGNIVHVGDRAQVTEDLDTLPLPSYGVRAQNWSPGTPGLSTARGCPFGCGFCATDALWGRKVRFRSVDRCIEELVAHDKAFGLTSFRINDDSFCIDKGRVLDFCRKLRVAFGNRRIGFYVDANVDSMDEEIVSALEDAGCSVLSVGIESVAPRIRRKFIRKRVDLGKAVWLFERVNKGPIISGAYYLTGWPNETENELRRTMEFMISVKSRSNEWGIVTPYPGTELYRYAKAAGLLPAAGQEHFMHHSLATSMANIPRERHEELLIEILDISDQLRRLG